MIKRLVFVIMILSFFSNSSANYHKLAYDFNFKGLDGNQIDLNFCFGYREYPIGSSQEFYQQLQMSISLADIWFIKRRQK